MNLCLKRKTKTKNKNKNKKQKNSHGGESLFEKRLGRRPLDRELLPLLLTLLSGGDRQTKVSNLRPPKLVQQNISEKILEKVGTGCGICWNYLIIHLAAKSLWTMLRLSNLSIPRATSICQESNLLHSFGICFIFPGLSFHFFR